MVYTKTFVNSSTFIKNILLNIKDILKANISDPLDSSRDWIFTSYPKVNVIYPLITITHENTSTSFLSGQQSNSAFLTNTIAIRVWATNITQKDDLTQNIISTLVSLQTSQTIALGMYDLTITSLVDIDEDGDSGIKSKIIRLTYNCEI